MTSPAIIIGAGQAGAQGAASLRAAGYRGEIVLLGAEAAPPYQRPPLSKAYLQGAMDADRLWLKPNEFYPANGIDLRLGVRATAIDLAARSVATDAGAALSYDRLLIATGAPPRRLPLPGSDAPNVHYLRTLADADAIREHLRPGARLVVIGAGYIGLEVAASARKAGMEVAVIEAAERPLARVAGRVISSFFLNLHRRADVDLRCGARLEAFESEGGRVVAVVLGDGSRLPCDAVLVGVGAAPEIAIAVEAGLIVDNGIVVDAGARTSDPHVFAAGDCANFPSALYGRRMRLESVGNAIEQAKVAGANMALAEGALGQVYDPVPWFWSDQYDVKLQIAGIAPPAGAQTGDASETIVRGDPESRQFSVWSLERGRLVAVDAVNDPAAFLVGKRLIAARACPDRKKLADPAADLKSVVS